VPEPIAATAAQLASDVDLPATKRATEREESLGTFWALVTGGLLFVVAGWFLPWFVEVTANGVGFSPQDVVSSSPTGIGTVFVYLIGVAMVALLVGAVYDLVCLRLHRGEPFRYSRARAALAAAGAVSTVVVWYLIGVQREEPLFGNISSFALTDNAVWMELTGMTILAIVYGVREWIVAHAALAFGGVIFIIGALFPFIFNASIGFISWGASAAAIYVLLGLGLNVVVGFAGLLDLGYAAFFAIGAYTAGSMASPRHGLYLPFWVILFLGAAVAALFGAILGAPTLRLRGDYLAIVTLGFGEIIPDMATNNLFGQTGGPEGITGVSHPAVPGITDLHGNHVSLLGHDLFGYDFEINPKAYFWLLLIVIVAVVFLLRNLERSRVGRAWAAIREDEVAAAATGINTVRSKLLAFAIGASVSGFAGAIYGAQFGGVTPDEFEFAVSITVLTVVVLGGIGNSTGVAVGAILLSFVIFWALPHMQEWTTTFGHTTGITTLSTIDYNKFQYVVYGVILISIMLARPAGLLPSRARKVELQSGTESEALASVRGTV
jgi:branched-chain amino acid transport system permease protein